MPSRIATAVVVLAVLALHGLAAETTREADLRTAARDGDVARVRELLAAGVEVDSRSRYGATPLIFAAANGHRKVVELLLEAGADLNAGETFYNQTPLFAALRQGHPEIAVMLIEHGARDADDVALVSALQAGRTEILRALVNRGPIYDFEQQGALEFARNAGWEEIVALFEAARVKTELETVEVEPERLASYAGVYQIANGNRRLELTVRNGRLHLHEAEKDPVELVALSPTHFRSPADHQLGLYFFGRAGTVEGMRLAQGAAMLFFRPYHEDEEDTLRRPRLPLFAPKKDEPPAEPAPPRGEPIHWPSFRGPGHSGVGDGQGAPTAWDVETGKGVLWKTEIPGLGNSSPVVWGPRIFLTTAISAAGDRSIRAGLYGDTDVSGDFSEHTWKVLALDKARGEIVWERTAGVAVPATDRHAKSSQANSTPATDGRHLVVAFPTIGLVCLTTDGQLRWKKDLGPLNASWFYDASVQWGFGSSPILYEDLVILQADVAEGAFIAAYELATGREVWKTERDEIPTWATPTIYRGERDELIANGTTIRAYDPRTGRELWRLGPNSEVVIATPVVGEGLIFVGANYPPERWLYAVRPGAQGDVSPAAGQHANAFVAWSHERGGSYMPTPIVYGGILYVGHHQGRLVAYRARTGETIYRTRFSKRGTLTGSPVAADGRLYFAMEEGLVYVVKAGPSYQELAVNDMKEVVMTTPAISDGALFIRTRTHLYALGARGSLK